MELFGYEREEYTVNPIFEVICQLSFSTILRISSEDPWEFQEKIRSDFPNYKKQIGDLPAEIPKEVAEKIFSNPDAVVHKFLSEDRDWEISLANGFIALTNNKNYVNYEDFEKRFKKIVTIFENEYSGDGNSVIYNRIGLRYRNLICQQTMNIDIKDFKEVVSDFVAPELYDDKISDKVKMFNKTFSLHSGDEKVNMINTLGEFEGFFSREFLKKAEGYIIDIDCFTESRTRGAEDVFNTIRNFKPTIQDLFRSSITKEFHNRILQK